MSAPAAITRADHKKIVVSPNLVNQACVPGTNLYLDRQRDVWRRASECLIDAFGNERFGCAIE